MTCGEQCISRFIHEGKPTGVLSTVNNVQVYIATPPEPIPQKAILIFPDIYGVHLKNCQLIADRLAGDVNVTTYLLDLFSGDCAPEPGNGDFVFADWLKGHGPEKVLPIIESVMQNLTEKGVNKFAAVGYCFGGKYVFMTSQKNWIHVGATCHPSLLQIPDDLNNLLETSKVPLLINSCEIDQQFTAEAQKKADEILGDGKYKCGYKRNYYPGATHGFGCRADLSKAAEKEAFDKSFVEIVNWFKTHL
ncbi:hypothetical protein PGT21_001613 [Puccinia graminis f. sp. tritici]|uniref:Dienelactone hydrolase domain-containing protein n=1 Tax=Puccinia graminis f. sp. tritici TaxID=56615 RepID=A0A5B0M8X0_PUCGR|nr:hypothetical protein PGT21_001661 [Puccinia graminis f. sp. tritici]KAA1076294.1 hypothetical protein PGT21_001613 [Puccinia graminis f. sp. tritici]KAA1132656.1 hypothetical protein PGTUg99_008390 [Puccinia graminis f. sp. tritici]